MACMTHSCEKCGEEQFNNSSLANTPCKKCGGRVFHSVFDEEVEDGSGSKTTTINVHTCLNCREVYYNGLEYPSKRCGCGCSRFESLIGELAYEIPTNSKD